jgi:hypothetical protein
MQLKPDWEMTELKKLYEDIQTINRNCAQKLPTSKKWIQALIRNILNNFADSITFSLEENLVHFKKLFDCWLNE